MRLLVIYALMVAVVTATVSPGKLAATQQGSLWRVPASALIAADPAAASIGGAVVVGAVTILVAGASVALLAAVLGHVGSTLVVYGPLDLAHAHEKTLDYGDSAIVAAWIGVLARTLWSRHRSWSVVLVVLSALVGWALKGDLTVLDWEHAVALVGGIASLDVQRLVRSLGVLGASSFWRFSLSRFHSERLRAEPDSYKKPIGVGLGGVALERLPRVRARRALGLRR
jgi:hypothetical protein